MVVDVAVRVGEGGGVMDVAEDGGARCCGGDDDGDDDVGGW